MVSPLNVATHADRSRRARGLGRVDHVVRGDVAIQGDAGIRWRGIELKVVSSVVALAGAASVTLATTVSCHPPARSDRYAGLVVAIGIGDGSSDCHRLPVASLITRVTVRFGPTSEVPLMGVLATLPRSRHPGSP